MKLDSTWTAPVAFSLPVDGQLLNGHAAPAIGLIIGHLRAVQRQQRVRQFVAVQRALIGGGYQLRRLLGRLFDDDVFRLPVAGFDSGGQRSSLLSLAIVVERSQNLNWTLKMKEKHIVFCCFYEFIDTFNGIYSVYMLYTFWSVFCILLCLYFCFI